MLNLLRLNTKLFTDTIREVSEYRGVSIQEAFKIIQRHSSYESDRILESIGPEATKDVFSKIEDYIEQFDEEDRGDKKLQMIAHILSTLHDNFNTFDTETLGKVFHRNMPKSAGYILKRLAATNEYGTSDSKGDVVEFLECYPTKEDAIRAIVNC